MPRDARGLDDLVSGGVEDGVGAGGEAPGGDEEYAKEEARKSLERLKQTFAETSQAVVDGVTEKNSGKKIRKTHGTKPAEVGLSLDNAMRGNFNGIGLDLFAVGKELLLTDPFLWPRGQVNLDEGSNGRGFMQFAEQVLHLNLEPNTTARTGSQTTRSTR